MNLLISKRLQYFITAMETKCINEAADQLCITRSPLGRVLYEMEGHIGDKLFNRSYNNLEPTSVAYALYDKVKPHYDALCAAEHEFIKNIDKNILELIFDISIPYIIFQFLSKRFATLKYPVNCRRASISASETLSLSTKPNTAIFTLRQIHQNDSFHTYSLGEESLIALLPKNIAEESFNHIDSAANITLYIKNDQYFYEKKGFISHYLKDIFPYLNIKKTDNDLSAQLLSVSSGDGILLLPEHLSKYFNPPETKIVKLVNKNITTLLCVNKKFRNKKLIKDIISELKNYK